MHIALIGLPGSGKSTIGQALARQWELEFVDTDALIEREIGCTIRTYFDAHGEAAFREVEASVLAQCLRQRDSGSRIVATGGGIVLRPENRQVLRACSTVFYLRATPQSLVRRLRGDTVRPLMQGGEPLQRLQALLRERGPLYAETAHYTIGAGRHSLVQMVSKIRMQAELAGWQPQAVG